MKFSAPKENLLYGINAADAGVFALIVHAVQTLLVVVLGLWGWLHVAFAGEHMA